MKKEFSKCTYKGCNNKATKVTRIGMPLCDEHFERDKELWKETFDYMMKRQK